MIGIRLGMMGSQGGGQNWEGSGSVPSDLILTVVSATEIDGTFTINGTGQDGHKVYISTDNVTFALLGTLIGSDNTFSATGLIVDTKYYFYAKAYKSSNVSNASNTVCATTLLIETDNFIARISTEPEIGLKGLLNYVFDSLKTANILINIDYLVLYNLHTQQASLLNLKSASFNHTVGANDVVWTEKEGLKSDGDSGYIDSNCKTGDAQAARDDNFFGVWVRTSDGAGKSFAGSLGPGNTPRLYINGHTISDSILDVWNNSAAGVYSYSNYLSDLTGLFISQRTEANIDEIWYNGVKQTMTGGNIASAGLTGCNEFIGCVNANGTPLVFNAKQFALAIKGKSISAAQQLQLYIILNNFNTLLPRSYDPAVNYFTSIGSDFSIGENNKSTGLYFKGITYIVFQGTNDDPYIITYTNAQKLWSIPVKIAINPLINGDGHGQPALLIDDLGYIHIFFGCHYGPIKYSKSDNPEDISAWTAQADPVIGEGPNNGASYPQVFQVENGDIYLFYRGAVTEGWRFKISSDRGSTWSDATDYIITGNKYYSKINYKNGLFHLTYQYFPNTAGLGIDRFDIFYARMNPDDGIWKNIKGDALTLPLSNTSDCNIYDSGINYIATSTVDVDSNNIPYIFFTESTGAALDDPYTFKVIKWNGTNWITTIITTTVNWRNFASAIDVRSTTKIQVYPVVGITGAGGDIEKWESIDAGATWNKILTILSGKFLDPIKIYNGLADARMVVFSYKGNGVWDNYGYLYGDNGFA